MTIDTDLLIILLRDKEYDSYPIRVFVDTQKTEIVFFHLVDDDAYTDLGIAPEENAAIKKSILENLKQYTEIPVTTHAENHEWFQEFLVSINKRDLFFGSIGGFFKTYDEDDNIKYNWEDFRQSKVIEKVLRLIGPVES